MDKISLDVHTHIIPIVPRLLGEIPDVSWDEKSQALTIAGGKVAFPGLFEPAALVSWLDKNEIDRAWVAAPPPTYRQDLGADETRRWVRYLNTALPEVLVPHASRLEAIPHVPVHHPDVAVEIAKGLVADGYRKVSMPCGAPGSLVLSDAAFDPLWEILSDANAIVFLHPPETVRDPRLAPYYLFNLIGNPYETALAIGHLVFGRIVERYPSIVFCIAHAGGAVPIVAGRFDRGIVTKRPGLAADMQPPAELLKKLKVDCIVHSPEGQALVESVFGSDGVYFGSDWPFPMGLIEPHAQMANWPEATRRKIFEAILA